MEFFSIFNDVLGPVMRGPSSSHTAGSYRIGKIARSLLGEEPWSVKFTFDPQGSYSKTYRQQGADLAFAAGIMGWSITDTRCFSALDSAVELGIKIEFNISSLKNADHPNTVLINMTGAAGKKLSITAESVGGGTVLITRIEKWAVNITGKSHETLLECDINAESRIEEILTPDKEKEELTTKQIQDNKLLIIYQTKSPIDTKTVKQLKKIPGVNFIREVKPEFFIKCGDELFSSAKEMVSTAQERKFSLGEIALEYESILLGMTKDDIMEEMKERFKIMKSSVYSGLEGKNVNMQLLKSSAGKIFKAETEGKVALGGIHTRAAARAMAVMHVSNSMGVVCAAPTGGSAGVIPGVIVTLAEEKKVSPEQSALALLAAGAIGLIIAKHATFAAEVAGCQVEICAAGAMAAAAVVEIAGGTASQAADAAAISLQNTMGSVCDLVQGICEIPCHTRNAVAASSAFVCADLILGGYSNPINIDETIDAVYSVGKMLPRELKCTSLGGLAVTPSGLSMKKRGNKRKV